MKGGGVLGHEMAIGAKGAEDGLLGHYEPRLRSGIIALEGVHAADAETGQREADDTFFAEALADGLRGVEAAEGVGETAFRRVEVAHVGEGVAVFLLCVETFTDGEGGFAVRAGFAEFVELEVDAEGGVGEMGVEDGVGFVAGVHCEGDEGEGVGFIADFVEVPW